MKITHFSFPLESVRPIYEQLPLCVIDRPNSIFERDGREGIIYYCKTYTEGRFVIQVLAYVVLGGVFIGCEGWQSLQGEISPDEELKIIVNVIDALAEQNGLQMKYRTKQESALA
jgi:hypothetical protein